MTLIAQRPPVSPIGSISVFVPGKPAPQGSKKHIGKGILVESSARVKPWRTDVREAVLSVVPIGWDMSAAMTINLTFSFLRPKSHYTTKGALTKSAPYRCTNRIGDIDKLIRAVFDAMTSIAYVDDSQIVSVTAHKEYAPRDGREGVHIQVRRALL